VAISAIAASIAALAACFTVLMMIHSWRIEQESKRPYFTIKAPGIRPLPQSPPYRIILPIENVGTHPASNLIGKIIIIDKSLKKVPILVSDFSIANDLPNNAPNPWYDDNLMLSDNVPPMYILIAIKYFDPILKKYFTQKFSMKWDGVVNGTTHPDFVHTSLEENKKIIEHLKGLLEDLS